MRPVHILAAIAAVAGATAGEAQPTDPDTAVQAPPDLPGTMSWIQHRLTGQKTRDQAYIYTISQVSVDCNLVEVTNRVTDSRQFGSPWDEDWRIPIASVIPRSDVAGVGDFEFVCAVSDCISVKRPSGVSTSAGYDIQLNPPTLAERLKDAMDQLKALCKSKSG